MSFALFQQFAQDTKETKPNMTVPKYLYRTEECGGSGVRDLESIIKFEVFELGNTDILDYILKNYNLKNGLLLSSFTNTIQTMRELCKGKNANDSEALTRVVTAYGETMIDKFVESVITMVKLITKKDIKYGLWLASKNAVINRYSSLPENGHNDAPTDNIEMYETSDVILSDLGYEGILFAYETLPNAINADTMNETEKLENDLNEILMEKNQQNIVETNCLEKKKNNVAELVKSIFAKWSTIMVTMGMICKTLINDKGQTNPLTLIGKYRETLNEIYITGDNPSMPFVISINAETQIDQLNIGYTTDGLVIKGSTSNEREYDVEIELSHDTVQYTYKATGPTMTTVDKIRCLNDIETLLITFDKKFGKYVNMFIEKTRNI